MFKYTKDRKEVQFIKKMNLVAKQLRQQPTPAEHRLWQYLRNKQLLGYKFRRQHAIYNYIADFYCRARMLVIEVDGSIHNQQVEHDQTRDKNLESLGYTVVRFTNAAVLNDIENVLSKISQLLEREEWKNYPLEGGRGFDFSSKRKHQGRAGGGLKWWTEKKIKDLGVTAVGPNLYYYLQKQ